MSTFENDLYRWRETYFLLFEQGHIPTLQQVLDALEPVNDRMEVHNARAGEGGRFDFLTIMSPEDHSAMDIVLTSGDDVVAQRDELIQEINEIVSDEERQSLEQLVVADARFEIFHFEEGVWSGDESADEMLDPGGLLLVVGALAELVKGVAVDPQTGSFL